MRLDYRFASNVNHTLNVCTLRLSAQDEPLLRIFRPGPVPNSAVEQSTFTLPLAGARWGRLRVEGDVLFAYASRDGVTWSAFPPQRLFSKPTNPPSGLPYDWWLGLTVFSSVRS